MVSNAKQAAILTRRLKVAELLLRGVSNQYEICRRLGMEPNQRLSIHRDIKAIKAEWRESAVRDFDLAREKELAKIERLEREYWDAWERSKAEKTSSRTSRKQTGGAAAEPADEVRNEQVAEIRKEQRDGNPAFLDGVMRCIAKRCELLGLEPPKTLVHKGDAESPLAVSLSVESMGANELRQLRDLRSRLLGVAGEAANRN